MRRKALKSARTSLVRAQRAQARLLTAETLTDAGEALDHLATACGAIYEKLKPGNNEENSAWCNWFGRKVAERRRDELLRYVQHARNSEYHGIHALVEVTGPKIVLAGGAVTLNYQTPDENESIAPTLTQSVTTITVGAGVNRVAIYPGPADPNSIDFGSLSEFERASSWSVDAEGNVSSWLSHDDIPPHDVIKSRFVAVVAIDEKHNDSFNPPTNHLGVEIDGTNPNVLAELMLRYVDTMIAEAAAYVDD